MKFHKQDRGSRYCPFSSQQCRMACAIALPDPNDDEGWLCPLPDIVDRIMCLNTSFTEIATDEPVSGKVNRKR